MTIQSTVFESSVTEIKAEDGGDTIFVVFTDYHERVGSIFVTCYDLCWSAWFGSMGKDQTIRSFFLKCGADYLVNKLSGPKMSKRDGKVLARCVAVIHEYLKERPQ